VLLKRQGRQEQKEKKRKNEKERDNVPCPYFRFLSFFSWRSWRLGGSFWLFSRPWPRYDRAMNRATIAAAPSRPTLVDYVFLLVGCSVSLYLLSFSPLGVKATHENRPAFLNELIVFLPRLLRLPEGIVLMGPIFYLTQLVRRRAWGLTSL